jgi:ABC-type sugar transport system substrate-binding protein
MLKKRLVFLGLILILALGACSPAATEEVSPPEVEDPEEEVVSPPEVEEPEEEEVDEEPLTIGFSLPTLQFPFYVRMHDTFVEEAEARGWKVVFVDGNLDALTQVNATSDLLSKNIDALVMATWWIDAMPDVFDTAERSGIPVFLMDHSAEQLQESWGVESASGTDSFDAGVVGGKWMAERLKAEDKSSVNLVLVTMSSETAVDRCSGFVAGLEESGIEVNVLNEYLGDTRANGMSSMEDALITYPEGEIDLVFGYSAQSSLGAYDAIVAANRTEIEVVGFDGEDDEIALIDAGTQYIGTIVQYPDQMAIKTAELVEKVVVDGEEIEVSQPVPAGVYDGK